MTFALDWTGSIGDVWAAEWRRTDRSFADLSRHLDAAILAAAPTHRFRALDIGCGAGGTSLALADARPDATIFGADLSAGLVEVACERLAAFRTALPRRREPGAANDDLPSRGLPPARKHDVASGSAAVEDGINEPVLRRRPERWPLPASGSPTLRPSPENDGTTGGVSFETGDAVQIAAAHAPFDLLYSRHGVMFFDDPIAAFTALHTAAGPGARLVFSCFADWSQNAFARAVANALDLSPPTPRAPGPFAFADRDYVADLLVGAGWTRPVATLTPIAYRAGEGEGDAAVADALSFFPRIGPAAGPIRAASSADRAVMLDRLTAVLRAHRVGNAIDFPALAWIWSATA